MEMPRLLGGILATSRSPMNTLPLVGYSKPEIIRSVVVLPQPEGPSSVTISPSWMFRLMWSTATKSLPVSGCWKILVMSFKTTPELLWPRVDVSICLLISFPPFSRECLRPWAPWSGEPAAG